MNIGVSKDSLSVVSTVGGDHQSLHTQSNKQFLESRTSTFNLHKFYKHSVKSMAHSKGLLSIRKEHIQSPKVCKASARSAKSLQSIRKEYIQSPQPRKQQSTRHGCSWFSFSSRHDLLWWCSHHLRSIHWR